MDQRSLHRADRDLLREPMTEREARIADAARRIAFDEAADWLSTKQMKAENYPGGDAAEAKGSAAAYQNAAQEIYGWAIRAQPET